MHTERVRGVISASKPVEWFAKESQTFYAPDGRANVIVSSEPLDLDIDSKSYADSQGDLLEQEFPGYAEHSFEPRAVFGGRSGFLRRFTWLPEDSEPVSQIQVYYAELGRGYSATATTTTSDYPLLEVELMALLESLRIS
jgi:hypothetical protein